MRYATITKVGARRLGRNELYGRVVQYAEADRLPLLVTRCRLVNAPDIFTDLQIPTPDLEFPDDQYNENGVFDLLPRDNYPVLRWE